MKNINWMTALMSAGTNGIISAGGAIIAATSGNNELTSQLWILCASLFLVSMAKDIQAKISAPPVKKSLAESRG